MHTLNLEDYEEPGLYLETQEGTRITLTRAAIEETTQTWLNDPALLPETVRAATEYQPCTVCPERESAEICHAIMTTLPFFDDIDRYMSYDHVIAIYRKDKGSCLVVKTTTMQEALRYISTLSLTHYCEVGRKYEAFFEGINPLMSQIAIAHAVFRNMYLACGGDMNLLRDTLNTMQHELLETTRCQVKRLRLICKRDAFLNAFVETETTTEIILIQLEKMLATARSQMNTLQKESISNTGGGTE